MRKFKIAVLTATRAEYGLLRPVMFRIAADDMMELQVLVTGMHLSEEFGYTYREIEADGFHIDVQVPILEKENSALDISCAMARALEGFGKCFAGLISRPDILIVLGDRYETMAVVLAAANARIPIAHIHGGETTEGAIDEAIRHAITKFSYLHFASTDIYAKRIIQLGEHPERVFSVGALGVENIKNVQLMSKTELEKSIGFSLDKPYAVVTFHPVTLENESAEHQFIQLIDALEAFDMKYIITKANADADGMIINQMIDKYGESRDNVFTIPSLGMKRYLSALRYCCMVIGNSSSGIIEAPSFHIPTVNIGDRQKGRLMPKSVICCEPENSSIAVAMRKALTEEFKNSIVNMTNPYEKIGTSKIIINTIKDFLLKNKINLKKSFYNLETDLDK